MPEKYLGAEANQKGPKRIYKKGISLRLPAMKIPETSSPRAGFPAERRKISKSCIFLQFLCRSKLLKGA
jgi:hypothetical protein